MAFRRHARSVPQVRRVAAPRDGQSAVSFFAEESSLYFDDEVPESRAPEEATNVSESLPMASAFEGASPSSVAGAAAQGTVAVEPGPSDWSAPDPRWPESPTSNMSESDPVAPAGAVMSTVQQRVLVRFQELRFPGRFRDAQAIRGKWIYVFRERGGWSAAASPPANVSGAPQEAASGFDLVCEIDSRDAQTWGFHETPSGTLGEEVRGVAPHEVEIRDGVDGLLRAFFLSPIRLNQAAIEHLRSAMSRDTAIMPTMRLELGTNRVAMIDPYQWVVDGQREEHEPAFQAWWSFHHDPERIAAAYIAGTVAGMASEPGLAERVARGAALALAPGIYAVGSVLERALAVVADEDWQRANVYIHAYRQKSSALKQRLEESAARIGNWISSPDFEAIDIAATAGSMEFAYAGRVWAAALSKLAQSEAGRVSLACLANDANRFPVKHVLRGDLPAAEAAWPAMEADTRAEWLEAGVGIITELAPYFYVHSKTPEFVQDLLRRFGLTFPLRAPSRSGGVTLLGVPEASTLQPRPSAPEGDGALASMPTRYRDWARRAQMVGDVLDVVNAAIGMAEIARRTGPGRDSDSPTPPVSAAEQAARFLTASQPYYDLFDDIRSLQESFDTEWAPRVQEAARAGEVVERSLSTAAVKCLGLAFAFYEFNKYTNQALRTLNRGHIGESVALGISAAGAVSVVMSLGMELALAAGSAAMWTEAAPFFAALGAVLGVVGSVAYFCVYDPPIRAFAALCFLSWLDPNDDGANPEGILWLPRYPRLGQHPDEDWSLRGFPWRSILDEWAELLGLLAHYQVRVVAGHSLLTQGDEGNTHNLPHVEMQSGMVVPGSVFKVTFRQRDRVIGSVSLPMRAGAAPVCDGLWHSLRPESNHPWIFEDIRHGLSVSIPTPVEALGPNASVHCVLQLPTVGGLPGSLPREDRDFVLPIDISSSEWASSAGLSGTAD